MTPEEQAEWEFLIDWFWPSGLDVKAKYRDLDDLKSSYDYRIYENLLRQSKKLLSVSSTPRNKNVGIFPKNYTNQRLLYGASAGY
jgi:hypothetical protein